SDHAQLHHPSPHLTLPSSARVFCTVTASTPLYTLSLHDALPISKPFGLAAFGAKPAKRSQVDQRCAQRLDRSQSRQSLGLEGPSGLTPAPATANWQCHQSALLQLAKKVARRDVLELAGG